jgi:hypothetical protein
VFIVSAVPFAPARRLAAALNDLGYKARSLAELFASGDPSAVAGDHAPFVDATREVKRCRDELVTALRKQSLGEALADLAQEAETHLAELFEEL